MTHDAFGSNDRSAGFLAPGFVKVIRTLISFKTIESQKSQNS
jgi:hypothetical protein